MNYLLRQLVRKFSLNWNEISSLAERSFVGIWPFNFRLYDHFNWLEEHEQSQLTGGFQESHDQNGAPIIDIPIVDCVREQSNGPTKCVHRIRYEQR